MMPQISFVKNKAPVTAKTGANLMQTLLDAGIPVASSCKGDGVCCKCLVTVVCGMENLSPKNKIEIELHQRNNVSSNQRVSCQTSILGDITLDTGYW